MSGGEGMIREYEFLTPVRLTIISERRRFRPYGLFGGRPGASGRNVLFSKGRRFVLGSKANLKIKPDDILRVETPGGGGYGLKR
jgi:N-methylhydantoinase B/oxoprolinase/acetone carboxylase alpha subunit